MFVVRKTLLGRIMAGAAAEHRGFDVWGALGSGKTSLLQHLHHDIQLYHRVFINLEDFNPGHPGESGDTASVGAVQGSFLQLKSLLTTLIERTGSADVAATFAAEVEDTYRSEVSGRRVHGLDEAVDLSRRRLTPKDLADTWRTAATLVNDRFVPLWNAQRARESCLLLLDNVDEVADQELGRWLGSLLPRLERTTVVLTGGTPPDDRDPGWMLGLPRDLLDAEKVLPFERQEVERFLQQRVGRAVPDPDVGMVHQVSDGHPATVAVVYDLLLASGMDEGDRASLVANLPRPETQKVAALVEQLMARRDDPVLTRALWAVTVPRRFDAELLRSLLSDQDLPDSEIDRLFEELRRLPFVESLDDSEKWLRVHSFVRDSLIDRMLARRESDFQRLHQHAADHFERAVREEGDEGSGSYGEAYVYENPYWQLCKREWLYHRGHARRPGDKKQSLLAFSRVFFEAFWWWGNYVHFDFCDRISADLGQIVRRRRPGATDTSRTAAAKDAFLWPELALLHDNLRLVLREYPPRSWKPREADWGRIRRGLLAIERACGLRRRDALTTDDERAVAALLDVFLAHTYRYSDPRLAKADHYYERAKQGFDQLGETWSTAWVHFEHADLRFERSEDDGRPPHTDPDIPLLWRQAADIVQPEHNPDAYDDELVSNLHRLRGDCCWSKGDVRRAALWYGRAVLHAYLFLSVEGLPSDDDIHPPDEYTLQFYVDVRALVIGRLLHLWQRGDHDTALDVAEIVARLVHDTLSRARPLPSRDEVRAALAAGTPVPVALLLFPPGPEVPDLGRVSSPFLEEYDSLVESVDDDYPVNADLHDEVWP